MTPVVVRGFVLNLVHWFLGFGECHGFDQVGDELVVVLVVLSDDDVT